MADSKYPRRALPKRPPHDKPRGSFYVQLPHGGEVSFLVTGKKGRRLRFRATG